VIIPAELLALIVPRSTPDRLEGTFRQVEYATSIRRSMLAVARRYHPELVDLLLCVRDATWFLGNRNRPLDQLRWPSPGQMIAPETREFIDGKSPCDAVDFVLPVKAERHGWHRGDCESPVGSATPSHAPTSDRHPDREGPIRARQYIRD
jgi:hypothetical protein